MITPRAIATDPSDNVFVADQNDRVPKFNSSGVFQFKFATGGSSFGSVVAPSGVAVDRTTGDICSAGNVYVTDLGNHRIEKFTSGGSFIMSWGNSGTGNGQFSGPEGIGLI